nr:hypothetical protein [Tanacetum cinerariifolium]
MVRSGPGRSSVRSGPTRHNLRVFGKTGPDRPDRRPKWSKTPDRDRTDYPSVRSDLCRAGLVFRSGSVLDLPCSALLLSPRHATLTTVCFPGHLHRCVLLCILLRTILSFGLLLHSFRQTRYTSQCQLVLSFSNFVQQGDWFSFAKRMDCRVIPDYMTWRSTKSCVSNDFPTDGYEPNDVLSSVWLNQKCDPIFRRKDDNNVMSIFDFMTIPSWEDADMVEEPHGLGRIKERGTRRSSRRGQMTTIVLVTKQHQALIKRKSCAALPGSSCATTTKRKKLNCKASEAGSRTFALEHDDGVEDTEDANENASREEDLSELLMHYHESSLEKGECVGIFCAEPKAGTFMDLNALYSIPSAAFMDLNAFFRQLVLRKGLEWMRSDEHRSI